MAKDSLPDGVKILEAVDRRCAIAEIESVAAALNECYNDLPPEAKARAMRLAHGLSNLRKELT